MVGDPQPAAALMRVMGVETETDYRVENGMKIVSPSRTLVMTPLEDGTIQGPLGIKLTKCEP
jgi:predicted ATP-grasp superfamily ATP-dependent carboligase